MNNKKSTNPTIAQIKSIEDNYGLHLFSMGLTQLIEMGTRELSDAKAVEQMEQEIKETTPDNAIMSADFKCAIIQCAAELSKFTPFDLMRYIKKHMIING